MGSVMLFPATSMSADRLDDLWGPTDEEMEESGPWQERSLCSQTDPEAFFPEKGGSTREAKRICSGCEVKAECLDWAVSRDERFGIWGGLSERERRRLRRRYDVSDSDPYEDDADDEQLPETDELARYRDQMRQMPPGGLQLTTPPLTPLVADGKFTDWMPEEYLPWVPSGQRCRVTDERIAAVLSELVRRGGIIRGQSPIGAISLAIDCSDMTARAMIAALMKRRYVGWYRLSTKTTIAFWLRQAGWDWYQANVAATNAA